MTTTTALSKSHWDLSNILDLVNTLGPHVASQPPQSQNNVESGGLKSQTDINNGLEDGYMSEGVGLGDFSRVWQFLGSPPHTTELESSAKLPLNIALNKDDYASDGAAYHYKRDIPSKIPESPDRTDNDELTASASDAPALTKTQRKKLRRKERKAAEEARKIKQATVSESEADTTFTKNPARKASSHTVQDLASSRYNLRSKSTPGTVDTSIQDTQTQTALQAAKMTIRNIVAANKQSGGKTASPSEAQPAKPPAAMTKATPAINVKSTGSQINDMSTQAVAPDIQSEQPVTPTPKPRQNTTAAPHTPRTGTTAHKSTALNAQHQTPYKPMAAQLIPSSVQPVVNGKPIAAAAATTASQLTKTPMANVTRSQPIIQPIIVRSGEDRHWALLIKIINDYYEDRKYLVSPMTLTTHNNDPKGIHIFVDASNIFIGFKDQLKRSRGIHPLASVPDVELSFDALALLIERRRPVARRVLAGSTPHIPAFDKAKAVGYECSILEKVYKARELTERQIYFKDQDYARRHGRSPRTTAPPSNRVEIVVDGLSSSPPHGYGGSGGISGSETTTTPQYAPAKMIEQGVDEILHMKMLESLVDWDEPSTMVLATGDAAAAEYSPGFMAQVQRALKKGWRVELVSWSKNISTMYTRRQWTEAWGDRFRIVYLDDYAEELLDM